METLGPMLATRSETTTVFLIAAGISTIFMLGIAGFIWSLAKWLSWAGVFLIPILCGLLVGLLARDSQGLAVIYTAPMIGGLVIIGALGALSCMLLANIKKIETELKAARRTKSETVASSAE